MVRNLPTAVTPKLAPNLSAINLRTTCRVHNPKSNPYCRGSLPLIQRKSCCSCLEVSVRGRPVPFRERSTRRPRPLFRPLVGAVRGELKLATIQVDPLEIGRASCRERV